MKFVAEIGMSVVQILADAHEGLVESESGFDANDGEIESVGEGDADALLTVFDHALEKEAGNEETEGRNADQQGHALDAGESHDAGQAEECEHDPGPEIVAEMAGFAKAGLNQPEAGAGDVGGRKRDGFADGIEGLLEALSDFERRLFAIHGGMTAKGAQTGSQHGRRSDDGGAEGEDHQHDGDEHDDG